MTEPRSDTPRVDEYLQRLEDGQVAIVRETMGANGLQESDVQARPFHGTPEQTRLLKIGAKRLAEARQAEREGRRADVRQALHAFHLTLMALLKTFRDADTE